MQNGASRKRNNDMTGTDRDLVALVAALVAALVGLAADVLVEWRGILISIPEDLHDGVLFGKRETRRVVLTV